MNKGIPNVVMQANNQTGQLPLSGIPDPEDVLQQYQNFGGQITVFSGFGTDPLEQRVDLIEQREEQFKLQFQSFNQIFQDIVNGNSACFRSGLLHFIDISINLCRQL